MPLTLNTPVLTRKEDYFLSEYDLARCCYGLLDSQLFLDNKEYVRRQFAFGLLQEEDARVLHVMAAVLLHDGRSNEATFEMMLVEGAFTHLVTLIQGNKDDNTGLHRLLLQLLGEMSRIQRLSFEDLGMPHVQPIRRVNLVDPLRSHRGRYFYHLPFRAHRRAVQ